MMFFRENTETAEEIYYFSAVFSYLFALIFRLSYFIKLLEWIGVYHME